MSEPVARATLSAAGGRARRRLLIAAAVLALAPIAWLLSPAGRAQRLDLRIRAGGRVGASRELFVELARIDPPRARARALVALEAGDAIFWELIGDDPAWPREAFEHLDDEAFRARVIEALHRGESDKTRRAAAQWLGWIGRAELVGPLYEAACSGGDHASEAMKSLESIRDPAAVDPLLDALQAERARQRRLIIAMMVGQGGMTAVFETPDEQLDQWLDIGLRGGGVDQPGTYSPTICIARALREITGERRESPRDWLERPPASSRRVAQKRSRK